MLVEVDLVLARGHRVVRVGQLRLSVRELHDEPPPLPRVHERLAGPGLDDHDGVDHGVEEVLADVQRRRRSCREWGGSGWRRRGMDASGGGRTEDESVSDRDENVVGVLHAWLLLGRVVADGMKGGALRTGCV